jgi:hypothetical protein
MIEQQAHKKRMDKKHMD